MPDAAVAALDGLLGRKPRADARAKKDQMNENIGEPPLSTKQLVIGAAFPRTGTTSLTDALDKLGFGPTYHITEMLERNELEQWDVDGADYAQNIFPKLPNFAKLLADYGSGVDVPFCIFWKEIFEAYPNSKVILTIRDEEKWYKSCYDTISKIGRHPLNDTRLPLMRRVAYSFIPVLRRLWNWEVKSHWGPWQFQDKEKAIASYKAYQERVRACVPKEQLLEFSVKDGWGPLCKFLGVSAPSGPFPHVNDTNTQLQHAKQIENIGLCICMAFSFVLIGTAWLMMNGAHEKAAVAVALVSLTIGTVSYRGAA